MSNFGENKFVEISPTRNTKCEFDTISLATA